MKLVGSSALVFKIVNTLITFKNFAWSTLILSFSFLIIWGIAFWILTNEFQKEASEIPLHGLAY
jgi:POT family proton-dependent oligopeptide transporter